MQKGPKIALLDFDVSVCAASPTFFTLRKSEISISSSFVGVLEGLSNSTFFYAKSGLYYAFGEWCEVGHGFRNDRSLELC